MIINRFEIHAECPVCASDFVQYDGKRGRPKVYCSAACRHAAAAAVRRSRRQFSGGAA